MERFALSLLGPYQLLLDGNPVSDFESDRVRALLAFLAMESDKPHRRDRLAALFWPDWPDRSALTNLRNALSSLRKTIGDRAAAIPILQIDRETVQFGSSNDSYVDVHAFKTLLAPDQSPESLEQAIALYRGPFLEGFGLRDSTPFEEWAQLIREQMRRYCLTALERLSDFAERQGHLDEAAAYCWKQIDLAPWHEEAHRHLMALLDANGQRSAALAQYETCRRLLEQELNVTPAPETVALYERIRAGHAVSPHVPDPTVAVPPAPVPSISPPPASPLARAPRLPVWLTPFVGREELLAEIHDRLQDPTCRLLTLMGPGGSGKTRLAVEAGARAADLYPASVFFVSLASLQLPENIVPAIAHALGFSFHEQEEPRRQLLHYLRRKTLLLVLDNFEHLITPPESEREGGVEIVNELLVAAPGVKVLITSRAALNVQAEYLLQVPGMDYPEQPLTDQAAALAFPAVQLFIQDARRVRPGFEPTADDLAQIVQICHLAQGMPLGLLLAAAWMRMLSPREIATHLAAQKLDFLEAEWHDVPERQRSMRAVFDYSWRLLSERERASLAGLSVFRGGFTYLAARQVAMVQGATTLRDLMGLVNSSMLQRAPSGRFEMHELLRQYAEEKLRQSPEEEQSARNRHSTFYMAALRQWALDLRGAGQQGALTELDVENDNVRAAWSWAVRHGQMDRLADGMEGLGPYCDWRARYKEGEKLFRIAADGLGARGSDQPPPQQQMWASALAWQARFDQRLGRIEQAREHAHASLSRLDEPTLADRDTRPQRALALQVIGEIEAQSGNCQDGREPLASSLAIYRELGDRRAIAHCLRSLGRVLERMGEYAPAAEMHWESVEICRTLGAQRDTVDALLDLLVDLRCVGEDEEAERLVRESYAIAQQLGDPATLAAVRYRLGMALMDTQPAASLAELEEVVTVFYELGDRHRWALAVMRLGNVRLHLGQYVEARAALHECLAWYREVDNWWGIGAGLSLAADLEMVEGRLAEARQFLLESVEAFRKSGARSDVGWALSGLGLVTAAMGEIERARGYLTQSIQLALKYRHQRAPGLALAGAAVLVARERQGELAIELWALMAQEPLVGHSHLYQDLYRRHIVPVADELGAEQAAAAHERGRARNIWTTLGELLTAWGAAET